MKKTAFLIFASIILIMLLSFFNLMQANQQKKITLEETKKEYKKTNQQIENFISQFEQYNENKELEEQLNEIKENIEQIKQENNELKKELHNRKENFNIVESGQITNMNIESKSGFIPEMFEIVWSHYDAKNLKGSGKEFLKAENETGINALVLAGIASLESGWGSSQIVKTHNNYFGWGAYDEDPYRYAKTFKSREESILIVAEGLKNYYVQNDYNNLEEINKMYATDPLWDVKVANIIEQIVNVNKKNKKGVD